MTSKLLLDIQCSFETGSLTIHDSYFATKNFLILMVVNELLQASATILFALHIICLMHNNLINIDKKVNFLFLNDSFLYCDAN